ncbi:MAG: PEGA domain-containing protein [Candidatus Aminicenantaceae bacterium]
MQKIKTLKTTKILAYTLVGAFIFYLNSTEISFSKSHSPEDFIQEGKSLFEKGDYESSLQKLTQAETYFKSVKSKSNTERLAEIYFFQGLNFAKQGNKKISKAMFKRALHYSPGKEYNVSLIDESTKKLFVEAKSEFEKESSPRAMGKPGQGPGGGGGGSSMLLGVLAIAAIAVLVYLLLKKKEEEEKGSIQVNSTPEGATIYLDGSDTGKTSNATLTDVPVGSHTVKLVKERYQDWEDTVTVAKDTTATVSATLEVGSFTEDFNDGEADHFEGKRADWTVSGGVYVFNAKSPQDNGPWPTSHYTLGDFKNFTYEAAFRRIQPTLSDNAYGLAFRGNNDFSKYYLFDINPSLQRYSVWEMSSGTASSIVGWINHSSINSTGWNTLKVEASGTYCSFYINNVLVESLDIAGISQEGSIGLWAAEYPALNGEVNFENVSVSVQTPVIFGIKQAKRVFPRPPYPGETPLGKH